MIQKGIKKQSNSIQKQQKLDPTSSVYNYNKGIALNNLKRY